MSRYLDQSYTIVIDYFWADNGFLGFSLGSKWFSHNRSFLVRHIFQRMSLQKTIPFQWLYKMMCSTPVLYWTNIPEKHAKSMRARVGRPCCGGYPCQPPKMHQISKEVVRDWSLWGSWCFSIFLMISRNLLRQEDARRQKLLLHVLMWMMLMNAYDLCNAFLSRIHLVFLHNDSSCILLYLFCLNFIPWTPTQKKRWTATMTLKAEARHRGCSRLRHNLNICRLLRSGLPKVVELQKT